MIGKLKLPKLALRDGTSQAQRLLQALGTGYVAVDERSMADLIRFAREYAQTLNFFNEQNEPEGDWSAFLDDPASAPDHKRWIADILAYADNPDIFKGDAKKLQQLSQPHLVLFIAFLRLLGHIKEQLNGFTQRHLDFYYRDILGLNPEKPIPDSVNVIVELAGDVQAWFAERGTMLLAGKDSLGKDLVYQTDRDALISKAQVQDIKTLFVDKKISTLKSVREENDKDQDKEFLLMMQLSLGDPLPGDPLPDNRIDFESFSNDYVLNKLFISPADWVFLMALKANGAGQRSSLSNWDKAYQILEDAYKTKILRKRQQELRLKKEGDAGGSGVMYMLTFALGEPGPLDPLPPYNGNPAGLEMLTGALAGDLAGDTARARALQYINTELQMSEEDFKLIINTISNTGAAQSDWDKVYSTLEKAQRKKRNVELPAGPVKEALLNVFSISDAKASAFSQEGAGAAGGLRFNTFGKGDSAKELAHAAPAAVGFAVTSPQLVMAEGTRVVTLTLWFQRDATAGAAKISSSLSAAAQPFLFFLSHQKGWIQPAVEAQLYGNFIAGVPGDAYQGTVSQDFLFTKTSGNDFKPADDIGKYIVIADKIYSVQSVRSPSVAGVRPEGTIATGSQPAIKKYSAADVYLNAIQFRLRLSETDSPVRAPGVPNAYFNIDSQAPVLAMVLNQMPYGSTGTEREKYLSMYQLFMDLQLIKVKVAVDVSGVKALTLQNNDAVLNYKKPFEPFGFQPRPGDRLYLAHPEISGKRLDTLSLSLEWMNPPSNFKTYYENYWRIKQSGASALTYEIAGNTSFQAWLELVENGAVISHDSINLFADDTVTVNNVSVTVPVSIANKAPDYRYSRIIDLPADEDAVEWKRYFRLELNAPDFQHESYPVLLTKQALTGTAVAAGSTATLKELMLNPPYTPKLKSLTAAYTASFEISPGANAAEKSDQIFHIDAFGYKALDLKAATWFLPHYSNAGELYIGFKNLPPAQNLSLLFQMAEGSADPDLEQEPVTWSYLSGNIWLELPMAGLSSDTTNGLLNTGIVEFAIPADIATGNTLMPGNLYWLKAGVSGNTDAIPDTIAILAQGISATFVDRENAADHLLSLLPPGSIKETVQAVPEIKKITQPYTSSKGRPAEAAPAFYNRVSERLRHKNRALTMWDYERIVLDGFPQIYKAKCVPAGTAPGRVDIIVIPDIQGKIPFNPFQPKVPADTIYSIQQYLEQRAPAHALIKVKNPSYTEVEIRATVKIGDGYSESYFLQKLNDDLKKYLAPWAYNEGADVVFGGKLYANMIVNFIAEQFYIDYVAGIKLFQREAGTKFIDVRTINDGENTVIAQRPDVILVSAPDHRIDVVRESTFEEKHFTGIGYMMIELDFIVG